MTYSDEELIERIVSGEKEAFKHLVEKYEGKAYRVSYGILENREEALDIVQEAFIRVFRDLKKFCGRSGFYTWFYRIVVNLSIDKIRKRKREGKRVEVGDNEDVILDRIVQSDSSPVKDLINKELSEAIGEALEKLPPDQKTIIILRDVENLSYKEISQALKISIGTVMSRLHYARKKLQEYLNPYLRGGGS